jgi:MoCo/4Fe-4S cofactor protein with predicted Tat translocation signal
MPSLEPDPAKPFSERGERSPVSGEPRETGRDGGEGGSRRTYWRSLAELADAPEYRALAEAEFPAAEDPTGVSRRRWLQLMGASLVLAGVNGCRWKKDEFLPLTTQPPNRLPGQFQRFATARDLAGSAIGLWVTSIDGRPIKIEGNPRHPFSLGATDAWSQASILELYDPDRSQWVVDRSGGEPMAQTWPRFIEWIRPQLDKLAQSEGDGLAILSEASSSPTLRGLRDRLLKRFPRAVWCEYEPLSRDNEREGARLAFGQAVRTHLALDKANVLVCLDADLLGDHPAAVRYARDFSTRRDPAAGPINRLYVVEPCFTITGSVADHRLPLRCEEIGWFAKALHAEVVGSGNASGTRIGTVDSAQAPPEATSEASDPLAMVRAIAKDLKSNGANTAVVAGPRQPPEVHALVHEINAALGNVGMAVWYTADPEPDRPPHVEALKALCDAMSAGKVRLLVILGGNPVYDAPADFRFADLLEKVPSRVHWSLYDNETSRRCTWLLPRSHYLESWGDARAWDGTYSLVQPLIAPLYDTRTAIELLAMLEGEPAADPRELVRSRFQQMVGAGWESRWDAALESGVLPDSAWPRIAPKLARQTPVADPGPRPSSATTSWELVFCPDASVFDGRFANNGWLQEMPDAMTKLTWDNALLISPASAAVLGVEHGEVVKLTVGGREATLPVFLMPGQAPHSAAVALGYGRTAAGKVGGDVQGGSPVVGVNVYPLRTSQTMGFAPGAAIAATGKKYPLATTQDHSAIDVVGMRARGQRVGDLVREFTWEEYREKSKQDPQFARHVQHLPPLESLWREFSYEGRRWGMTIDLSKCIGCSACVVACQAENNIPVVGKERVLRGREMHWLRVDRYYRGDAANPRAAHQVILCQQCENAPCEQVCPVAATVHSREGLNDMVYNRCVGTRYCSNNCPYKVRRFNFFNYRKDLEDPENEVRKMVLNPEVTVRSRGVMEKCTFCVQRIQAAKIDAKNRRVPIPDGAIQTACQQVCPTQAIVFGDLNYKDEQGRPSRVAQLRQAARAYEILAELNVKPRISYLAVVRNPNPEVERLGFEA